MNRVPAPLAASARVWTIGHSNSSAHEFIGALRAHAIEAVADVRRFPGSRKHPQFGATELAGALAANGIDYAWLAKLGGRRRDDPGIQQLGWRNPSFRSYAAFMWSDEFAEGLGELTNIAHAMPTAVMCSELLWWRCHRALIADALRFLGFEVVHIMREGAGKPHPYTAPARIVDGALEYPAEPRPQACCGHD